MRLGFFSLGGGQGKTTGTYVCHCLQPDWLLIDGDPQALLSTVLEMDGMLEDIILNKRFSRDFEKLGASYELQKCQQYLQRSGNSWGILRSRLDQRHALIDLPPQDSALTQCLLGACDAVVLPFETTLKGYSCLINSLNFLRVSMEFSELVPRVLGLQPTRARMFGRNLAAQTKRVLEQAEKICEKEGMRLFTPVVEHESYKLCLETGNIPATTTSYEEVLHGFGRFITETQRYATTEDLKGSA